MNVLWIYASLCKKLKRPQSLSMFGCSLGESATCREAPAKLKAFCPRQVVVESRLNWQVEEECVLQREVGEEKSCDIRRRLGRQAFEHGLGCVEFSSCGKSGQA